VLSFLAEIAYRLIPQELSPNRQCTANPLAYHNMQQLRTLLCPCTFLSHPPHYNRDAGMARVTFNCRAKLVL